MTSTPRVEFATTYQASWKNLALASSMGWFTGWWTLYKAQANDKPLVVNGIIELSVDQASMFFYGASLLMFCVFVLSALAFYQRLRGTNRLVITTDGVLMPGPAWSPRPRFYPFSSIAAVKVVNIRRVKLLQAKTNNSWFTIADQNLFRPEQFEKVVALVSQGAERHLR